MSSVATSFVRSDEWNADVLGSASAAYRISSAVKRGHNLLQAHFAFAHLNNLLERFFEGFFKVIENAQKSIPSSSDSEPMTPEEIRSALDKLWNMHSALDRLYELSVRKGFRSKFLFTKQLTRLGLSRERVVDVIQWIQYSVNEQELASANEKFALGLEELQRRDTITVD